MKKLCILISAVMVGTASQAARLTFYVNGIEEVTPGSTVYSNNKDIWDHGETMDVTMNPRLFILSDEDARGVTVTAVCTNGHTISLQGSGSTSTETGTSVSQVFDLTAGDKTALDLEWTDAKWPSAEPMPTIEIDVKAVYAGEETAFHVVLNKENDAVGEIYAGETPVTVVNGRIYLNGTSDIEIYTLDGRRVANDSLGTGIYLAAGRKVYVR